MSARGFTLLELIVVIGILGVIMGVAAPPLQRSIRDARSDSALAAVLNAFRLARDRAIGERRNIEITFTAPNRIQGYRVEIPGPEKTLIIDTFLEGNLEFRRFQATTGDTPDGFGGSDAIAFGTSLTRSFTSEGTFVDSVGDPMNGTLFLGNENQPDSARAITVLGASALLRAWKWNGREWVD